MTEVDSAATIADLEAIIAKAEARKKALTEWRGCPNGQLANGMVLGRKANDIFKWVIVGNSKQAYVLQNDKYSAPRLYWPEIMTMDAIKAKITSHGWDSTIVYLGMLDQITVK